MGAVAGQRDYFVRNVYNSCTTVCTSITAPGMFAENSFGSRAISPPLAHLPNSTLAEKKKGNSLMPYILYLCNLGRIGYCINKH